MTIPIIANYFGSKQPGQFRTKRLLCLRPLELDSLPAAFNATSRSRNSRIHDGDVPQKIEKMKRSRALSSLTEGSLCTAKTGYVPELVGKLPLPAHNETDANVQCTQQTNSDRGCRSLRNRL